VHKKEPVEQPITAIELACDSKGINCKTHVLTVRRNKNPFSSEHSWEISGPRFELQTLGSTLREFHKALGKYLDQEEKK